MSQLSHPGRGVAQAPAWVSALWDWLVLEWQFGNRTALETEKQKGPLMFRHCLTAEHRMSSPAELNITIK